MKKITDEDIAEMSIEFADNFNNMGIKEIAMAVLFEVFENPQKALDAVRPSWRGVGKAYSERPEVSRLRKAVGKKMGLDKAKGTLPKQSDEDTISKEENRSELIKMIDVIKESMEDGEIERKDGLKLIADIRVKLNDKFEIEEKSQQRRLIVVPQKRDMICAHTQRECTYWPTKEACKLHYKLIDAR